jgi:cell division GTPase FtsZ
MSEKINLERMAQLLNGNSDISNNSSNENFPSDCKELDTSGINIDMIDICLAMSAKGRMSGHSNEVNFSEIKEDIANNISEYDRENAKNLILIFSVSQNCSMFSVSDAFEDCTNLVKDATAVIGTNTIDIDKNLVRYKILLTGIKDDI